MKLSSVLVFLTIILTLFACKDDKSDLPVVEEVPSKPVITSPNNDAFLSNCVNVEWNTVNTATEYQVQIGTDDVFSLNGSLIEEMLIESGTTSWLFNVEESGPTFIRMKASNTYGESDWSDMITFSVDASILLNCTTPVLTQPNLISPANQSSIEVNEVTFEWGEVGSATQYHLQVASNSSFVGVIYDNEEVFETQRIVQGITAGDTYYWRVKGKSNIETSPWSATWTFTGI